MSEAFSRLLDFLASWWTALRCWDVLDVEEIGFIRRLGRYSRDMHPGVNWRWPLIESACTENAQEGVYVLDPQSLRTVDGVDTVIRVSVTFRVVHARRYFLEAWGALNNLRDLVGGEVGEAVSKATAAEVFDGSALRAAERSARKHATKWGVRIVRLRRFDLTKGRSYRLWQTQTSAAGQG